MFGDGGNGENSLAMVFKATMCEGRSSSGIKKIQSKTTIRQNVGRTFWWLTTKVIVFSGNAGSMCKGWGRK